jgi:valyl-tRNA synthetase
MATDYLKKLAFADEVELVTAEPDGKNNVAVVTGDARIFIPLLDLIDRDKEIERLKKEEEKLMKEIVRVTSKLTNEKFISKAPQSVIDEEKEKGAKYEAMIQSVRDRIESLS